MSLHLICGGCGGGDDDNDDDDDDIDFIHSGPSH
jgi:hypothetical protein